ncbi:hypothetical protein D3I05_13465, partial [Enterococcus faecium]|nr:hypothetical protein [Enterococcus faecium]
IHNLFFNRIICFSNFITQKTFFNGIYMLFQKLTDDFKKKTCHNISHIVQKNTRRRLYYD